MSINKKTRTGIAAGTAVAAGLAVVALLGGTSASAADSTPGPDSSATQIAPPAERPMEEALTGDAAVAVQAAVEATYPDATIVRMEKDADGDGVYEAHVTKADGTRVTVLLDENYAITGELEGPMGKGGPGGPRGQRSDETVLTGDDATKVQAAVEATYPDATIDRMETDADGNGVYEAHITKGDGTHATVYLDESFAITGEDAGIRRGPGGHGGPGGPGRHGGPGAPDQSGADADPSSTSTTGA